MASEVDHQRAVTGAAGPRTPAIVPGLQRHWRADAEPDRVTRFINWWIIVECLEIETSNITPVGNDSHFSSTPTRVDGA